MTPQFITALFDTMDLTNSHLITIEGELWGIFFVLMIIATTAIAHMARHWNDNYYEEEDDEHSDV